MRAERSAKSKSSKAKRRSVGAAPKGTRQTAGRVRRSKRTSRKEASVGEAAARVAKSGARLVGHAGLQIVSIAADTAREAVGSALESAAELVKGADKDEAGKSGRRRRTNQARR